ncbi:purine and uridine phosphorylase [Colletotrichum falcatum]|nr:purine and uridine phosphorylase [Colletotrichum falcatum]
MADSKNYTVGWICALPIEFSAAKTMLDEEHNSCPLVAQHDDNNYALGRIGGHNVVIAVMPGGEYGTTSATTVARDMVHSFPNVRIGLMVGIGGGAPSLEHDVRLGDVVVSSRYGSRGGVFQYDFGKAVQGQNISFEHMDFLNQPPTVLRTAVSALESQYEMEGHQLNAIVDGAFEQWPRLRKRYSRPHPSSDRLYRSDIIHPDSSGACSGLCGDDPAHLIHRTPRDDESDNDPAIHYGLIASANSLMKNATVRDKMAEEGVLCFEMEAAGLMNHFPCLVIRGICDYSDSHKNNEWQGFAAMMAAAYAKDLLRQIPPSKVEAESRIGDALVLLRKGIDRVHRDVDEMKNDAAVARKGEYLEKLYCWLSAPGPSTNAELARARRHAGTGNWLLNSATFREWEAGERQHLWLYGYAGCGKTVLSTKVLDHLRDTSADITLGFFFDFNNTGNQKLENLLRSLASQMYRAGGEAARRLLDDLFRSNSDGLTQPGISALAACVNSMLRNTPRVAIVLDALDECREMTELLSWIQCCTSRWDNGNIKLIVTGRPEDELNRCIPRFFGDDNCTLLDKKAVDADIRSYITHELRERQAFVEKNMPQNVVEEILTRVGDKADGMFRWAACQLDILAECLHPQAIQEALNNLPPTLNETYKRMMQRIPSEYKTDAIRLLQFIVHAKRHLTLSEAIDVVATQIDGEQPGFNKNRRLFCDDQILRYCPGLVVITEVEYDMKTKKEIHLAHFSVKEYLARDEQIQLATANSAIAKTCLKYMRDVTTYIRTDDLGRHYWETIESAFPLARHARYVWTDHARLSEHSEEVFEEVMWFLQDKAAFRLFGSFYNAGRGISRALRTLLDKGADTNAIYSGYFILLTDASMNGHQEVVQLLLDNGADVNRKHSRRRTALQAASKNVGCS